MISAAVLPSTTGSQKINIYVKILTASFSLYRKPKKKLILITCRTLVVIFHTKDFFISLIQKGIVFIVVGPVDFKIKLINANLTKLISNK